MDSITPRAGAKHAHCPGALRPGLPHPLEAGKPVKWNDYIKKKASLSFYRSRTDNNPILISNQRYAILIYYLKWKRLAWITMLIIYQQIMEFPGREKGPLLQEAWLTLLQSERSPPPLYSDHAFCIPFPVSLSWRKERISKTAWVEERPAAVQDIKQDS